MLTALVIGLPARAWADDRPAASTSTKEEPEHVRIGPLVGVGFPRPFAVEGLIKLEKQLALGAEYSFLPRMTIAGASTRFDAFAADARWFPFKGGFFIGLRGGRQWLSGSMTFQVAQLGSFTETADAATWFLNPRVGFLYTWPSGITLGVDAGIQVPIGATYARSGPATAAGLAQNTPTETTLRQIANTFGNETTPTVDLFRLGFLF